MKNTIAGATFVLLGASAATVGAINLGSDTLEDVTKFMLRGGFCAGAGMTYEGGGSSGGEAAMIAGTQQVSPMDRPLSGRVCQLATNVSPTDNPGTAYNIMMCLDGLSIIASKYAAPTRPYSLCSVKYQVSSIPVTEPGACVGCIGTNYNIAADDWRDVLRVLYAGMHHNGIKDCNSAVRRTLAQNYAHIFQGTCTATATPPFAGCGPIQHLFRRGDASGATDTFLKLLLLPPINATSFCNSAAGVPGTYSATNPSINNADYIDEDPIRRPCAGGGESPVPRAGEQLCNHVDPTTETPPKPASWKNTLGLVLPITVPANLSTEENYPTNFCTFGEFDYRDASGLTRCPDGINPGLLAGTCLLPLYRDTVTGARSFNCISRVNNRGVYMAAVAGDGRAHNMPLRHATGRILRDEFNRRVFAGFNRLHTNRVMSNAAECVEGCGEPTATRQIGCLVGASPCSQGFAGLGALISPFPAVALAGTRCATTLRVRGIEPTNPNVQNLILGGVTYPISHKLYLSSTVPTITDPAQAALMACFRNPVQAEAACVFGGYVPSPTGPSCEDFDEAAAAADPESPYRTVCATWLATNPARNACLP